MDKQPTLKSAKIVSIINLVFSSILWVLAITGSIVSIVLFIKFKNNNGSNIGEGISNLFLVLVLVIFMIACVILTILGTISLISSLILLINSQKSLQDFYKKRKTIVFSSSLIYVFSIILLIAGIFVITENYKVFWGYAIIILSIIEFVLAFYLSKCLKKIKKYIENSKNNTINE